MAILTTIRAVIKDQATRNQVHIIQKHLTGLGKDFKLFQERMDKLALHISQANQDVEDVNISARKLTSRFGTIENVDLKELAETNQKNKAEVFININPNDVPPSATSV